MPRKLLFFRLLGVSKIVLILLSGMLVVRPTPFATILVRGDDQPPYTPQPTDQNSVLCVVNYENNPGITDDTLEKWINDNIVPKGYHDMVFVFGQCHGGGFIDEMLKFGNDTHPVVAMSSASFNEAAAGRFGFLGVLNNVLDGNPDLTMKQAFDAAKAQDPHAVGGEFHETYPEHPQYSSRGANADNLKLGNKGNATSRKAILFAGSPTEWIGDWDDMDNMYKLLKDKCGFSDDDIVVCARNGLFPTGEDKLPCGGKIDRSGTAANLSAAIKEVAGKMNSSEQFFFWSADHGDFQKLVKKEPKQVDPGQTLQLPFVLDEWMKTIMKKIMISLPFVILLSCNLESSDNTVYLNDNYIGNLSSIQSEQVLYFNDNVVPLYTDQNNTLKIMSHQDHAFNISDAYMDSGAIPRVVPEGGVGGFTIPVDKYSLLAPYIGLTSAVIVTALAATIFARRKKRRNENR